MTKFKIYMDRSRQFRWQLVARNGEIIAVSESYVTRSGAEHSVKRVKALVPTASVVHVY